MDIIARNLFRLIRAGVFAQAETIEPMSAWKWHRLYEYSVMHSVAALVLDGIERCRGQFFMSIPDEQWQQWNRALYDVEQAAKRVNLQMSQLVETFSRSQLRPIVLKGPAVATLYPVPLHRETADIDFFFPFETQAKKADQWAYGAGSEADNSGRGVLVYRYQGVKVTHHRQMQRLTNLLLNYKLVHIVERELREQPPYYVKVNSRDIETLPPTLALLHCLLCLSHGVLNDGITLKQLVDLGVYLRCNGHHVDFVQLDNWIEMLSLQRIAFMSGRLLEDLLLFTPDELPFMGSKKLDVQHLEQELFTQRRQEDSDWYFTQGNGIFVHNTNNSAMMWRIGHSARNFWYYPKESITNLAAAFAHSLSHIEE